MRPWRLGSPRGKRAPGDRSDSPRRAVPLCSSGRAKKRPLMYENANQRAAGSWMGQTTRRTEKTLDVRKCQPKSRWLVDGPNNKKVPEVFLFGYYQTTKLASKPKWCLGPTQDSEHFLGCGPPPAPRALSHDRQELQALLSAELSRVEVSTLAGLVICSWPHRPGAPCGSSLWELSRTESTRHGKIKGGRPVNAPVCDPDVSRAPSSRVGHPSLWSTVGVQPGRKEARLFHLHVQPCSLGATGQDSPQAVVSLGAVPPARAAPGVVAEPVRHAVTKGARPIGGGHGKAKTHLHHGPEEERVRVQVKGGVGHGLEPRPGPASQQQLEMGLRPKN